MIDESAFQAVRYLCVTIWISPQKRPLSEVSVGAPAVKVPRLCSERTGGEEKDPGRRHRRSLPTVAEHSITVCTSMGRNRYAYVSAMNSIMKSIPWQVGED